MYLTFFLDTLRLTRLQYCKVYATTILGSIVIDSCKFCEFYFISQQVCLFSPYISLHCHSFKTRIKSTQDSVLFAFSKNAPALEDSVERLAYAPFFLWHPSIPSVPLNSESQMPAAFDFSLDESEEMEPGKWIPCPDSWKGEGLSQPLSSLVTATAITIKLIPHDSSTMDRTLDYPHLSFVNQIPSLSY